MRKITTAASLLLLFLLFHACLAAAEQKLLENITFAAPSAGEERVTFKLDSPNIPKIFAIKGENPRVVFDFINTRPARLLKNTINTNGKLIRRIRMGLHTEPVRKTRVVFDLATDNAIDFKQDFNPDHNTLTISVFHLGKEPVATPPQKEQSPAKPTPEPTRKKEPPAKKVAPAAAPAAAKQTAAAKPQPTPAAESPLPEVKKTGQAARPVVEEVKTPEQGAEQEKTGAATEKSSETPQVEEKQAPSPTEAENVPMTVKAVPEKKQAAQQNPQEQAAAKQPAPRVEPTPAVEKKDTLQPEVEKKTEQPAASLSTLNNITFDGTSNRGEMVLFNLDGFRPPTVFGVEKGHPRVICEFKQTRAAAEVPGSIKTDGTFVHKIRTTRDAAAGKVRVVIDLAPGNSYDLQQVFFKEDNLFVLIVNTLPGKGKK
jgi:hypothetical protein